MGLLLFFLLFLLHLFITDWLINCWLYLDFLYFWDKLISFNSQMSTMLLEATLYPLAWPSRIFSTWVILYQFILIYLYNNRLHIFLLLFYSKNSFFMFNQALWFFRNVVICKLLDSLISIYWIILWLTLLLILNIEFRYIHIFLEFKLFVL